MRNSGELESIVPTPATLPFFRGSVDRIRVGPTVGNHVTDGDLSLPVTQV